MALDDREATFVDVNFTFRKLMPVEAYDVFMRHVRPLLEGASTVSADGGAMAMLFGLLAKAPQEHMDALRAVLFANTTYTSANQPTPTVLINDMSNAFQTLEPAHIGIVLMKSFAVNFSPSWDVIKSEFPQVNRAIQLLSTET